MSKELQAWQEIKLGYICGQGAINEFSLKEKERENLKIIESALKEHEVMEVMKQTKIVVSDPKVSDEDFEKLKNQGILTNLQCEIKPLFDEGTQKSLKALEKIKNKGCSFMEIALIVSCDNYDEYCREMNSGRVYSSGYECEKAFKTQFEFDLLKEVLK